MFGTKVTVKLALFFSKIEILKFSNRMAGKQKGRKRNEKLF